MQFWRRYLGPSTMVTAAFIGPGTVTMCTIVGVRTGSDLLWALVFSVVATIVLQEMSARLGVVTRLGMGEALRERLPQGLARIGALIFDRITINVVFRSAAWDNSVSPKWSTNCVRTRRANDWWLSTLCLPKKSTA